MPTVNTEFGSGKRLLLGPAGSGKSRRLLDLLIGRVGSGQENSTLLLVPTASYRDHTRNLVLRDPRVSGFSGACVLTFGELLSRLAPAATELSMARRELLVRRLLQEDTLEEFAAVREFPGFRAALVEAAEEVRRAGLEPGTLEQAVAGRHAPFLRFFRQWQKALAEAGDDDSQRAARALEAIAAGRCDIGVLLVDGFTDFTHEQSQLLDALIARTPEVHIALTLDRSGRREDGFFYLAERSRARLKKLGFAEVWLDGNHRAGSPMLAAVEEVLRGGDAAPPPPLFGHDGSAALIMGADRRDEAELIGREIVRLVRDGGFSYRDIGIIVRHAENYAPLFRGVFRRLGIPLRVFFPVPLSDTALGRHLELCLDLFPRDTRPESLFRWLKSPYCIVRSRRLAERFEYRATAHLADARAGRWERCLSKEDYLRGTLGQIEAFDAQLAKAETPHQFLDCTRRMWDALTLRAEIEDGRSPDRILELRAEAAAFRRWPEFLDELAEAMRSEATGRMTFASFRELLRCLMSQEQFTVRDRRQDAVNLMNPFEARQWELRVTFVAGLVEKEFPAPPREALFLDDRAREAIQRATDVSLPTLTDRRLDEHHLFYVAATRCRERLYLSYPQTDMAGKKLLPSFFLRDLHPLLNSSACRRIERKRSDIVYPLELAAGESDLLAIAHAGLGARSPEPGARSRAVTLYEYLREAGATRAAAQILAPHPQKIVVEAALDHIRATATNFSASDFQAFAECPFKYFAGKLLRIKELEASELDPLKEGEIAHATIEEWTRGGFAEPIETVLARCFAEITRDIPPSHITSKARAELARILKIFAAAESKRGEVYRTRVDPQYIELRFGKPKPSTPAQMTQKPPLRLTLADGTEITVGGRLDRVELAGDGIGVVVDFKYSKTRFDDDRWEDIQEGRQLQLPIYLLALKEIFGMTPAGAELYALKADKGGRRGMYDADHAARILKEIPAGGVELPHDKFLQQLEQAREQMREQARLIREGWIQVSSGDHDNCRNCDFADLCRLTPWEQRQQKDRATAR